jgi:hypothetical protein
MKGLPPFIAITMLRLNDAICTHERVTGQSYTLILVPADPGQPVMMSLDGKPISTDVEPGRALDAALQFRRGPCVCNMGPADPECPWHGQEWARV